MFKIGNDLRSIRRKRGLSQEAAAQIIGVSMMTLRRWEADERVPRLSELQRIAQALNITAEELINGPSDDEWSWTIRAGNPLKGEIDLTKRMMPVAEISASADGAAFTLGAKWEVLRDDDKFEALMNELRRMRGKVIQLGEDLAKGA